MAKQQPKYDYDVAIIGAGLIGLSSADALLGRGLSVCAVDIAGAPMTGASHRNSGMVHPSQAAPWAQLGLSPQLRLSVGAEVHALAQRSAVLIEARSRALKLPQTTRAKGCLQVFHSRSDWEAAAVRAEALGIEYLRRPAGAMLSDKPALFYPEDASGNAYEYGMALAGDIAGRGADILTGEGALPWLEDGRVVGVRLGSRNIRARHTVLAAGMQSKRLAARIGIDLPILRSAGWAVNYAKPEGIDLPEYPVMEAGNCSALSVFGDVLRLSGTLGETSARKLIEIWTDLAPQVMAALGPPLAEPWKGDRPVSQTGKPFIGRSALPGLWVNTGHGHMGWTLCAGSGELLADMIAGGKSDARFAVPAAKTA